MRKNLSVQEKNMQKRHGKNPLNILSMLALSATTLSGHGVITQSKDVDTICKTMR